MVNQIDINKLLQTLELPLSYLAFMQSSDINEMKRGLESFKKLVLAKRKKLAFKYHPDKGGDIEKLKEINNAVDIIEKLQIVEQRPVQQVIRIYQWPTWSDSASTSTSTGW